ncbi:MAG: glycosyltransferase family 2 protein [bacterium]
MHQKELLGEQAISLVSLAVMSFNSKKYYKEKYEQNKSYLKHLLISIKNQTYPNLEIIIIDDCSDENPFELVKTILPQAKMIRNEKNLGLLKSENKAIEMFGGKYAGLLNQDLYLEGDYIEKLVEVLEKDEKIGVCGGKTRTFLLNEKGEPEFSQLIDSAGMLFFKDRNIIEAGRMEEDNGQYNKQKTVFGITGAAPLFRKEALEDIKIFGEYFDEDFQMYKDDVDLCWRMNLRGWKCEYAPQALAHHARTSAGIPKKYRKNFLLRRFGYIIHRVVKKQSGGSATRRRDVRNHYWMLVKNDTWQSLLKSAPFFLWRELQKLVFGIFFEPNVYFPGWVDFFGKLGKMKGKRKIIQSRRKIIWQEMEKRFEKGIW